MLYVQVKPSYVGQPKELRTLCVIRYTGRNLIPLTGLPVSRSIAILSSQVWTMHWSFPMAPHYRGADKSLARPGGKQAGKHVRDARDCNNIETRAVIKSPPHPMQGKAPREIHAILTETLACFLPGRAKDLSAPLYCTYKSLSIYTTLLRFSKPTICMCTLGCSCTVHTWWRTIVFSVKWFQQVCHLRTCGGFEWKERWPTYVSLWTHLKKIPKLKSEARNMISLTFWRRNCFFSFSTPCI